ncbi:hypothetical protein ATANTOWER_029903 [Ataeniobius toweri]|uniref:Uncharacterized protein n=1 Tax=Ataeniobius toweri TaxID=208326 RepID=A0ABU7AVC8_9TELE|nr:hypothetical protein [Ataeniobius toweri]
MLLDFQDSSLKFPSRINSWLAASGLTTNRSAANPVHPPTYSQASSSEDSSSLKDQAIWINESRQGNSRAEVPDSTSPFPLAVSLLIPMAVSRCQIITHSLCKNKYLRLLQVLLVFCMWVRFVPKSMTPYLNDMCPCL